MGRGNGKDMYNRITSVHTFLYFKWKLGFVKFTKIYNLLSLPFSHSNIFHFNYSTPWLLFTSLINSSYTFLKTWDLYLFLYVDISIPTWVFFKYLQLIKNCMNYRYHSLFFQHLHMSLYCILTFTISGKLANKCIIFPAV